MRGALSSTVTRTRPARMRVCAAVRPVDPAVLVLCHRDLHPQNVLADPDGELSEGDLLVDSELILPTRPDLGLGERTRKITTVHSGQQALTREHTVTRAASASAHRDQHERQTPHRTGVRPTASTFLTHAPGRGRPSRDP